MFETTSNRLSSLLESRDVLFADGAMGTNLFELGLSNGACGELWNVDLPERVQSIHRSFVDAGSDIILTNTFGANRYRLGLHGGGERAFELNQAGARIAREVADEVDRDIVVAGSVGPTGDVLEPLGERTQAEAEQAFEEQIRGLADGGADVVWIETIFAENELDAATSAAQRVGLPYVTTMTFDTGGKTMMGITAQQAARHNCGYAKPPLAYGANCGVGPAQMMDTIRGLVEGGNRDSVVVAKCNCGVPEMGSDMKIRYSGTPEIMADYARLARDAGVRIIGGCCGTTADHIRVMVDAVRTTERAELPDPEEVGRRLGNFVDTASNDTNAAPESGRTSRRSRRRRVS